MGDCCLLKIHKNLENGYRFVFKRWLNRNHNPRRGSTKMKWILRLTRQQWSSLIWRDKWRRSFCKSVSCCHHWSPNCVSRRTIKTSGLKSHEKMRWYGDTMRKLKRGRLSCRTNQITNRIPNRHRVTYKYRHMISEDQESIQVCSRTRV